MNRNIKKNQTCITRILGLVLLTMACVLLPVQAFAKDRITTPIMESADRNEPQKAGSSFSYITPAVVACYNNENGIDVRIKKISGAVKYQLYRYDDSKNTTKYVTLYSSSCKTYNGNIIYIDRLDGYNRYNEFFQYCVIAYNSSGESTSYSNWFSIQRLAPVNIYTCRPESSFEITVQWKSTGGTCDADGYQVQYAKTLSDLQTMNTRGTFHYKNVTGKNNLSCTLAGLSSNTKYYFRVRAYGDIWVNGVHKTVWSAYSTVRHTVTNVKKTRYTKYRAVLIGNANYQYSDVLKGPLNDVNAMSRMLKKFDYSVKTYKDLTRTGMINAISNGFSGATDQDISLFYYSGHGASSGSLVGIDDGFLSLSQLASLLSKVPGRVMIILDSCYSGQGIRKAGASSDLAESSAEGDPASFNQAVIDTFAAADPGVTVLAGDPDVPAVGYGELRTNKFYVITASAYNEVSWETYNSSSGLYSAVLTRGLIAGTGYTYQLTSYSGKSPADTNNDRKFTLRELFYYANSYVHSYFSSQNVQWYPMGAVFTILVKN